MSATVTLWKRVEGMFRPRSAVRASGDKRIGYVQPVDKAADSSLAGNGNGHASATGHANGNGQTGSVFAPWSRWRRRATELRENYLRTAELIDAVHEHFKRADERAAHLVDSIERMRVALEAIGTQQREQSELVARIDERLAAAETHAQQLAGAIRELPPALRSQADAVQAVSSQLESSRATDARLVDSLGQFERAVSEIRESGNVQIDTLNRLQLDAKQDRDALERTLRRQNRRFALLSVVTTILSLVAICSLALTLGG